MKRLLLLAMVAGVAAAQTFEVASVKENPGNAIGQFSRMMEYKTSGNLLTMEGWYAPMLVTEAYDLKNYQLVWSAKRDDIVYDITGRASIASPTRGDFRLMLQRLLADRFGLKVHRESKEIPVFALVIAKGGVKFKESSEPEFSGNHGVSGRNQFVQFKRATIDQLVVEINGNTDRPVLDKTGLTGLYDMRLEATPKFRMDRETQDGDLSIIDALPAQLGLRLEPQKATIEMIVVDHIEKPSPN